MKSLIYILLITLLACNWSPGGQDTYPIGQIKIPQGEFVEITDNVTIRLGKINTETRDAEDIFLEQRDSRGGKTTITARYGAISTTPDFARLLLKMRDGRQVFIDPSGERANALSFETFDVEVDLPAIAAFRARGGKETEATVTELWHLLRTQTPQSADRTRRVSSPSGAAARIGRDAAR